MSELAEMKAEIAALRREIAALRAEHGAPQYTMPQRVDHYHHAPCTLPMPLYWYQPQPMPYQVTCSNGSGLGGQALGIAPTAYNQLGGLS